MRHLQNSNNPAKPLSFGGESAPKRNQFWLTAALIAASFALAAGAAFAVLWGLGVSAERVNDTLATVEKAAAHNAKKNGILGLWYETEGYGTVEFFRDGSFRVSITSYYWETGTFKYSASSGTGEYRLDDAQNAVPIRMENGLLNIGGTLYTTEIVEQQDMDWDEIIDYID